MQALGRVEGGTEREGFSAPLVRAAHEFEAQMMKELIRPITGCDQGCNEAGSGGPLSEFAGEALGQALSRAGGFGIADRILASLSQVETDSNHGFTSGMPAAKAENGLKLQGGSPIRSLRRIAYGDRE